MSPSHAPARRGAASWFGLDTGTRTLGEADDLAHELVDRLRLPESAVVCTHLVRLGEPHVALSLAVPPGFDGVWNELTRYAEHGTAGAAGGSGRSGRPDLAAAAALAAAEHQAGTGGRAVVFPGSAALRGTVLAGELLARSAIGRLVVFGGQPPEAGDLLETRDHVRPEWRDGELVLAVTRIHNGRFAPFEAAPSAVCQADQISP